MRNCLTKVVRFQKQQNLAAIVNKRQLFTGDEGSRDNNGNSGSSWSTLGTSLAASAAALALTIAAKDGLKLEAKESGEELVIAKENRLRAFSTPDKIFNFFASYKYVGEGRRTMMMSPMEFYSSITPDCTLLHGVGSGAHVEITREEIESGKAIVLKSPTETSILNKIGEHGLLSYQDYNFLIAIISTPRRYIDTVFNLFDVTGDGNVEAKEFAYVCTKMAHKSGGFGSYTDIDQKEILESNSGLLNFLFGKERTNSLDQQKFKQLQKDLLDEIIELEFLEYDPDKTGRIAEADFVNFLLKNGKLPPKRKAQLIKRIEAKWPSKGRGVSFPSFQSFFHVLAGSVELERALFYLDVEGIGVDKEEFRKISSWVSGENTSDHVVEILYELLDDDEDGRIYRDDIAQVLLDWRDARGFNKGGFHVSVGQIRI